MSTSSSRPNRQRFRVPSDRTCRHRCTPLEPPTRRAISRRIRLEAMKPLVLTNVRNDPLHVGFVQAGYRIHVPEGPVVLSDPVDRCKGKRTITVMVWLIHDRQVRWPFVGSPEIGAVALSAVCLVENVALCDKRFVLERYAGFGCTFRATCDDEQCRRKKPGKCVAGVDVLAPWTATPPGRGGTARLPRHLRIRPSGPHASALAIVHCLGVRYCPGTVCCTMQ